MNKSEYRIWPDALQNDDQQSVHHLMIGKSDFEVFVTLGKAKWEPKVGHFIHFEV